MRSKVRHTCSVSETIGSYDRERRDNEHSGRERSISETNGQYECERVNYGNQSIHGERREDQSQAIERKRERVRE